MYRVNSYNNNNNNNNVKTKFIKSVLREVVAHLKPLKSPFRQVCNVLFSASSILLQHVAMIQSITKQTI